MLHIQLNAALTRVARFMQCKFNWCNFKMDVQIQVPLNRFCRYSWRSRCTQVGFSPSLQVIIVENALLFLAMLSNFLAWWSTSFFFRSHQKSKDDQYKFTALNNNKSMAEVKCPSEPGLKDVRIFCHGTRFRFSRILKMSSVDSLLFLS